MISVLVVDDDPLVRASLARDIARFEYHVHLADSVSKGTDVLLDAPVDVLLTDLRMAENDGLELLGRVRSMSPHTRSILMSAQASARDYETALSLGAVAVLCKPFTRIDLQRAIKRAVESKTGLHGTFHGIQVVDLIQMLHLARRSVTIEIHGAQPALVHLAGGEVVHAECAKRTGEEAFRLAMALRAGSFRTGPADSNVATTITRPFTSLILDTLREVDERARRSTDVCRSQLPEDIFDAPAVDIPRAPSLGTLAAPDNTWAMAAHRAWKVATETIGSAAKEATAIAFRLDGERASVVLSADGCHPDLVEGLGKIAHNLYALTDTGEFVANCTANGLGVGVVYSARRGLAIGVAMDVPPPRISALLFRSLVSTTARCMLRVE